MRIALILLLVPCLSFQGCVSSDSEAPVSSETPGNGSAEPPATNPVSEGLLTLQATVRDGPIRHAKVFLASAKRGRLSRGFSRSDASGLAQVSVPKSLLETLQDDDAVYFLAESDSETTVSVNGTDKSLTTGQLSFRSLLGSGSLIASEASQGVLDTTTGELARASLISHFSNARMTLLEARLGLEVSIHPDRTPEDSNLSNRLLEGEVQMTRDLSDASSPVTSRFLLLAAATKALVENEVGQLLAGGSQARTKASSALLELARSQGSLAPALQANLMTALQAVRQDLNAPEFQSSFLPGQTKVFASVPDLAVQSASLAPLPALTEVRVTDITGLTPFTNWLKPAVLEQEVMTGGTYRVAPTVVPPGNQFVFEP